MMITIEDRPSSLLELLWIREVFHLHVDDVDAPPLLVDTPTSAMVSALATSMRAEWEQAWPSIWQSAVRHAGRDQDPDHFERLQRTADGSPERIRILQEIVGPGWRDAFGDTAFTDSSYWEWSRRGDEAQLAALRQPLSASPERRDLESLVRAWRAGLTKVVTIPCRGEFTRTIAGNALLVTNRSRAQSAAYRRALDSFS